MEKQEQTLKKDLKFNMTLTDYEEKLGRLMTQKGIRGVAVTSRDGEAIYYNDRIPHKTITAFTKACLDADYLCTTLARQNDPNTRLFFIRIETASYEMVVSVEDTHLAFMFCDPPESYNKEHQVEGDDEED